ncbi:inositol-trisphosphate 3-kinase homolog isoform X2 [Diorhabda carinulata]|uniref:inositol-trisphosphate 3-kinase homolog isoform X2 n=1 Tax=Diorhabda carinulata TaxID=1163345 RepID=UPI0025A13AC2|nr:inositol-trisphosphate 3-kinase homolog isoform X2 [Diorhabda carinulata]
MSDYPTNFPPQTYSSSFYINALTEGDKRVLVSESDEEDDSKSEIKVKNSPILDCFISTFLSGDKKTQKKQENNQTVDINKSSDKDIEVADVWKTRGKPVRSPSPHNAFKRWRIKANLKAAESKNGIEGSKLAVNSKDKNEEDMSLLKFLAINALDLSAPASDVLLKSRSTNWFQLSGHPDSLAPAGPGTVWKKRSSNSDDTERIVYEELSQDPNLCDIIPRYYREVEYQGETFIELQDLLHGFQDPYVVDIKMGTRTFLESEVKKVAARHDLYQKMIVIDPQVPTPEEHKAKAVTKLRYMQFREHQSSTCSQGFRIEAMKCRGSPPVTDLKKVKSREEVLNTLDMFLGGKEDVRQRLLARLCEIRSKIENSEYFKTREVVGSSLFIIYDDTKVGAWLIDFAKTSKLPEGKTVNHRTPWVQGNHEEGLLFGFDKLISIIESIQNAPSDNQKDRFTKPVAAVSVKS